MDEQFFRDTAETGREDVIQAGTFGGLNTTANALNLPWTDSPEMTNVDVTIGGDVVKRNGTRYLGALSSGQVGAVVELRLTSGLVVLVAKSGTSLQILEVSGDGIAVISTMLNVWSAAAADEVPSTTITNEDEPRIIFFTRSSPPIQIRAIEVATLITADAASHTAADTGGRFEDADTASTIFGYLNTTRVDPADISWDSDVLTYDAAVEDGDVFTFFSISWQWWAEAELYAVPRFYNVATRFHIDPSDRVVIIPPEMTDGVELDEFGMHRLYNAFGGQGNRNDSYFIRNIRPANGVQYLPSTGVITSADATWDFPPLGTQAFMFGGFTFNDDDPPVVNDPYTLHMMRIRRLSLNGRKKILPANLLVQGYDFDAPYAIPQAGATASTAFSAFLLFDSENWDDPDSLDPGVQISTPARRIPIPLEPADGLAGDYIMLDRGARRGAPLSDLVRFINLDTKWVGSAGLKVLGRYKNGACTPAYGLGKYADYGIGLFPTVGAIYGGRLVIGGVGNQSMRVLFSSVTDTEFPGDVYQGFTIDPFQPPETQAFDLELAGSTSEIVESMTDYQGSVFIGTTDSLYRVFSRTLLTAQTALIQLTGRAGALNSKAFAIGAGALYYQSRRGIYQVLPSDGLDDSYTTQDISLKIRGLVEQLESRCSRTISRMAYDAERNKLYVSVYIGECPGGRPEIYVYHVERQAWTRFRTYEPMDIVSLLPYRDTSDGTRRFLLAYTNPAGTSTVFIRTEWDYPIDHAQLVTNSETATILPPFTDTFATLVNVQRYVHKIETCGFNDVEDLTVTLDSEVLEFGAEWTKQGRDSIYLRATPTETGTIVVTSRSPEADQEKLQVYQSLRPIEPVTGYVLAGTTLTFEEFGATTQHMWGHVFISVFRTPVFTWGELANFKRGIKWSGLFSNRPSEVRIGREVVGTMPVADAERIIGLARVEIDTNIAIVYNNERQGVTNYDVFRLGELLYDISLFDTYAGPYAEDDYAQIVEPLQGTGYSIQVVLWSYDRNTYNFAGYQLIAQKKGKRFSGEGR